MAVEVYASLAGMPGIEEQPEYYNRLRDVQSRASNSAIRIVAAVGENQELLGCVDFIEDMQHYASGGTASAIANAAGIRLLAVSAASRQMGVGKALTEHCVERARELGKSRVILHTTRAMDTAWRMYERMGFTRFPEIDFQQGRLEVFGFNLQLRAA